MPHADEAPVGTAAWPSSWEEPVPSAGQAGGHLASSGLRLEAEPVVAADLNQPSESATDQLLRSLPSISSVPDSMQVSGSFFLE